MKQREGKGKKNEQVMSKKMKGISRGKEAVERVRDATCIRS